MGGPRHDGRHHGVTPALQGEHRLGAAASIEEGAAQEFVLGTGAQRIAVLVLRWGGALKAYVNSCPHQGTPLGVLPDEFFDIAGRHLLCRTHGAQFRPGDGYCIAGPCAGKSLVPARLRVADGELWLTP